MPSATPADVLAERRRLILRGDIDGFADLFAPAVPDGDALSFTRLQDMIGLTPGNLITHLRKLEEADYISSKKASNGTVTITKVALTGHGRAALGAYSKALRDLLDGL